MYPRFQDNGGSDLPPSWMGFRERDFLFNSSSKEGDWRVPPPLPTLPRWDKIANLYSWVWQPPERNLLEIYRG